MPDRDRNKKRNILILAALASFLWGSAPSLALEISTTSPWLTMMVRFIGGDYAKVQPLSVWNASGGTQAVRRYRGGLVLALDDKEAKAFSLGSASSGLALLYKNLPIQAELRESIFFDPSKLPFLGQRILNVLSGVDPENYPYYQRRLAEFQSRLESTLEMGRHLLPAMGGLDLTGASGAWVRAAVPGIIRPPADLWALWKRGESLDSLAAALAEAQSRGWVVITDTWTPLPIRERASTYPKRIALAPLVVEADMFVYLNNIYLEIWRVLRSFGS